MKKDLIIIDDIFPHPISGFRYEEFTCYLDFIPNSFVYTNGLSLPLLGNDKLDDLIADFNKKKPYLSKKVKKLDKFSNLKSKLLYGVFAYTVSNYIVDVANKNKTPFIFTLYPGGAFALYNEESDKKLREIFSSPWFYKVIVTQKITYNYLIENKFCSPNEIEYIFGVIMPKEKLKLEYNNKKYYMLDKNTLDICFAAHKYTLYGEDKGYDIFIEIAKRLSQKYDNISFHVVGPWNKDIINIDGIKNIVFYGVRNQDWFDDFYLDKDIILSPNINNKLSKGAFDGFPTGCATDAALRQVAMFVTDPLKLNYNMFEDSKDIVIIDNNTDNIIKRIEYFYNNPEKLKDLCQNSCNKIKEIYSFKNQMEVRINILTEAINNSKNFRDQKVKENNSQLLKKFFKKKLGD